MNGTFLSMAKKRNTPSSSSFKQSLQSFSSELSSNKSLHAVFGIALLFLTGFSLLASISSLFSWTADFSQFEGTFGDILLDPNVKMANVFGKLGAAVGFYLTVKSFGWVFILPMLWLIQVSLKWGLGLAFKPWTWLRRFLLWTLLLSSFTGLLPLN